MIRCIQLVVLLVMVYTVPAFAASWDELTDAQRSALSAYESQWSAIPETRQERLLLGADRWLEMSPEQRSTMAARFQQWQQLDGPKRQELMQRWQAFRDLTPQQQRRMRDGLRRFQNLSADQKRQLRQRFQNMSAKDRAAALQRMQRRADRLRRPQGRPQRPH